MNRIFRNTIFYLLILLVIIGIVSIFTNDNEADKNLSQTEFFTKLENGDIESFSMQPERNVYAIRGQLKGAEEDEFFSAYVINSEATTQSLYAAESEKGVDVTATPAEQTSGWVTFLTSIVPLVIIFVLFFFLLNCR